MFLHILDITKRYTSSQTKPLIAFQVFRNAIHSKNESFYRNWINGSSIENLEPRKFKTDSSCNTT